LSVCLVVVSESFHVSLFEFDCDCDCEEELDGVGREGLVIEDDSVKNLDKSLKKIVNY